MIQKSFPRGGKKPDIKPSNTLFSKRTKIKTGKQKSKPKNGEKTSIKDEAVVLNTAQNLRYSALHEGMIILGRIYLVRDYYAIVSLPGQISGKLQATDVSETYTNLLKDIANNEEVSGEFKPMTEIYKTGDHVVCYVKMLHPDSKKISLSLEPQLINANLNPSTLAKFSKVVLTVSSVEDHGYVLETGLQNFRAFLSVKDIGQEEIKLYPGKQIICAVKNLKAAENTFIANVSIKPKHVNTVETNITSLDCVIPGTQFSLTVNRILNNGLQVYFSENNVGYVNQLYVQNALSTFEKGQELVGILLYIVPTVKFAYFSLLSQEQEKQSSLTIGDVIPKAKVLSHDTRGILLQLKKGVRGYIPFKRTEVDFEKVSSVFITNSAHKCKIIAYDSIAKLYICTMEKKLLEEKNVKSFSLQTGSVIEVTVTHINEKTGFIRVSLGKISGIVPPDQVSDPGSTVKPKVNQTIAARVLEVNTSSGTPILTLKKSLVESKLPILCTDVDAKVDAIHHGSVAKITNQGVLVRFFNNVKGWIPRRFLNVQTTSQKWNLTIGQTVLVVIKSINHELNKITLALSNNENTIEVRYKIGDIVEGLVTDSSTDGVHLRLKSDDAECLTAFLPAGHMAPCYEVGKLLAAKTVSGDTLSAIVFSTRPNLILSTTFAPQTTHKINDLEPGNSVLCSVKMIHKESVKVLLPIEKCVKYGTVPINKAENVGSIYQNQILFGKIINIDKKTQEIILTTQLSKVWKTVAEHEIKMMTAVDVLSSYLNKISELSKNVYYTSKPISKMNIGQRVKGIVESVMDHGLVLKLERDVKGIVHTKNFSGKYVQGDEVEGSVLWINYPHEYIEITLLHNIMNNISIKQNKLAKIPIGIQLRGEIVLVTNWFILVILKGQGKGTLVALPVRRHLNDFLPDSTPYQIGGKVRCYSVLNKEEADILLPICMLKSAFETSKSETKQFDISSKSKRKIETIVDDEKIPAKKVKKGNDKENMNKGTNEKKKEMKQLKKEVDESVKIQIEKRKQEPERSNTTKLNIKIKVKEEKVSSNISFINQEEQSEEKSDRKSEEEKEVLVKAANTIASLRLAIPECGFKWDTSTNIQVDEESSSNSEEEVEESKKSKKKKLTLAERRQLERQKEREIREREEVLASCQIPQSVDQFDRLVLSSPDSSLVWMQYMAYHLQATEVEEARAVAKRALKIINFREEDERLNVWQAWLNLESRFGSLESLNEVFQEAVKVNDALKIYRHMLTVHIDAGRPTELEKTVNVMVPKFKQNREMWIDCGGALLKIGMKDKSRHIMQRALQSLPNNEHVDLMIRFAKLENRFGDKERSQTLFEQILSSYPKRTDVWSSYVDSLVKAGYIEIARKVLDRAITLALPVKKMKVLFKKYISFEQKHGIPENVCRIQELAVKYVEEQCEVN